MHDRSATLTWKIDHSVAFELPLSGALTFKTIHVLNCPFLKSSTFNAVHFQDRPILRPSSFETVHFRNRPFLRSSTSDAVHFQDRSISRPSTFETAHYGDRPFLISSTSYAVHFQGRPISRPFISKPSTFKNQKDRIFIRMTIFYMFWHYFSWLRWNFEKIWAYLWGIICVLFQQVVYHHVIIWE